MFYVRLDHDGVVINRTEFAGAMPSNWGPKNPDGMPKEIWVQHDEAQIGWRREGDAFVPPEPIMADPPEPTVPLSVTDRQFAQALAEQGVITWVEARAWGARGEVPAMLADAIDQIPDETDRHRALMFVESATTYERSHPMTLALAASLGWTDEQLDALWTFAATL